MMSFKPYITKDEAMIAFCSSIHGHTYNISYCGEINFVKDVAIITDKEAYDCFKVVVVNMITNQVRDITEEVAQAYIEQNIDDIEANFEPDAYVANSDAWEKHLRYLEAEEARALKYGTYEQQHRLHLSDVL